MILLRAAAIITAVFVRAKLVTGTLLRNQSRLHRKR
jgi:hypothetical protein